MFALLSIPEQLITDCHDDFAAAANRGPFHTLRVEVGGRQAVQHVGISGDWFPLLPRRRGETTVAYAAPVPGEPRRRGEPLTLVPARVHGELNERAFLVPARVHGELNEGG